MAWGTANYTDFQNLTATSTGAAGNTTAVSGWTDVAGSTWNVVYGTSTGLQIPAAQCNYTGTQFYGFNLIRPATETSTLYSRHVVRMQYVSGEPFVGLRCNSTANTFYGVSYGGTGTSRIIYVNAGSAGALVSLTIVTAYVSGHIYEIDFTAQGASPTTLVANVYDVTAGHTLVAYATTTDSTGPQVSGSACISQSSSASATQQYIASQSYTASALQVATTCGVQANAAGTNTVTSGIIAIQSSYKLYRDTAPNNSATGTLLTTVSTPTAYTDTPPSSSTLYYYTWALTDTGANTGVSSMGAQVTPTPYVICAIGDSLTYGLYSIGTGYDAVSILANNLQTELAPAVVTSSNQGVSGSYTTQWISGSTNLNNAITAFKSASTAAGANAKVYVQIMLGTNDANQGITSSTYTTNLSSTITALKGAGIANFKGIILHNPPALGNIIPFSSSFPASAPASLVAYQSAITSLVDNTTVFMGDTTMYEYTAGSAISYAPDGLHLTNAAYAAMGGAWAKAINAVINGYFGSVGNGRSSLSGQSFGNGGFTQ